MAPCVSFRKGEAGITPLSLLSRQEVCDSVWYRIDVSYNNAVARIVSTVLSRNRSNGEFEISILTCSITYMSVGSMKLGKLGRANLSLLTFRHRQHFRSDVLVTFHPPLTFRPKVR